jgi:nitroreductase
MGGLIRADGYPVRIAGWASAWDSDGRRMVARSTLLSHQARAMIRLAVLAPSSHNTQPWVFRLVNSGVDVLADRTRALPVNDPSDRELTISCGCALMNLRLAAAGQGFEVGVQLLPEAMEPDWLARVTLSREIGGQASPNGLADFIEDRRTYRKHFVLRQVESTTVKQLVEAANAEGAWLRPLLTDESRRQAADLVAEGDAAQWADPDWRRELAGWMHPRRCGDGLTVPALAVPMVRFLVRTFNMGGRVGGKDRELALLSPLLVVLGTDDDHAIDWLRAGQALQRLLLVACRFGLQAAHLNQPIQVASLRPKLQKLAGNGFAQILLRLGYPVEEIPAAPRRGVDEVIQPAPIPETIT